jgi:flagella basal body P-ring formation protein FlgA
MRTTDRKFVGFLTRPRRSRQIADGRHGRAARWASAWLSAFIVLLSGSGAIAAAAAGSPPRGSAWHATQDIARTAENFLRQKLGQADKRISLQAGWLDPRLQMPRCSEALEGFLRRGTKIAGRTVVGVRCTGSSPWKMYVTVDVIMTENVLVAARSLPGGHLITEQDVRVEERDVSGMVGGYLSGPDELLGQRLKHQLTSGRVITPSMLQADLMIHRGQSVTILVQNDALNIRMSGKALADGAVNQRIKVENLASKRVVEGIVRSPEHVEVLVY